MVAGVNIQHTSEDYPVIHQATSMTVAVHVKVFLRTYKL